MADIVLINPRFEVSYWGLEYALPFIGKRSQSPGGMPTAPGGLRPERTRSRWSTKTSSRSIWIGARADYRGRHRHERAAIPYERDPHASSRRRGSSRGGGPWVTVQEDYFGDLADTIFIGEAERYLASISRRVGSRGHQLRYEQVEKTDMTRVPTPRFDLLKMQHYLFGSLQFITRLPVSVRVLRHHRHLRPPARVSRPARR